MADLVLSIALALLVTAGVVGRDVQPSSPKAREYEHGVVWRTGSSDALNCLYLALAHFGRNVDYGAAKERLHGNGHAPSMADLQDVASEFGLDMSVIRCRPDRIADLPMPAIVPMRGLSGDGGEFILLLHVDQSRILFLNGGLVTYADMSWDDFRRAWSGYALVAGRDRLGNNPVAIAGFPLAALVYSVLRLRQHARKGGNTCCW